MQTSPGTAPAAFDGKTVAEVELPPRTGRSAICASWRPPTPAAIGTPRRARCRRRWRMARSARRLLRSTTPRAGGTIGLSQLASKRSGQSNQLTVMGLVVPGAIQTNESPVDLSIVTPIASLKHGAQSDRGPLAVGVRDAGRPGVRHEVRSGEGLLRRRLGRRHGSDPRRTGLQGGRSRPVKPKYVAYSGGGEATQGILSGSVDAGVSSVSEFADQVEAGKMRVLAVSTAEPLDVGGKPAKTIKEQGLDVIVTNWRGVVAPPALQPADADAAIAAMQKLMTHRPGRRRSRRTAGRTSSAQVTISRRTWTRRTRASRGSSQNRSHRVRRSFAGPRIAWRSAGRFGGGSDRGHGDPRARWLWGQRTAIRAACGGDRAHRPLRALSPAYVGAARLGA